MVEDRRMCGGGQQAISQAEREDALLRLRATERIVAAIDRLDGRRRMVAAMMVEALAGAVEADEGRRG